MLADYILFQMFILIGVRMFLGRTLTNSEAFWLGWITVALAIYSNTRIKTNDSPPKG